MSHVVHVLDSLAVGGMENGVINLVNALSPAGRHTVVTMSALGPLAERLPESVACHCIGKRPRIDVGAVVRLAALLRRLRPSIVHSRNWGAFDAIPAARLAGVPVVIHGEHGREAADPDGLDPRRRRLRRVFAPLVTRFVTVSFDLRQWLLTTVGLPAAKLVTIHNGVDVSRFAGGDRLAALRALRLPSHAVVIGTVGRLDPVKDHAGLLRAFAVLRTDQPSAELVIVGEGPCRPELERLIQKTGLTGHVHLLGMRRDVPVLLQAFDAFVLPSRAEGISNTVLEAMATGLPIVATRVGGNPELVEHGVTGVLVAAGNPLALAAALRCYVEDAKRREAHGDAGRRRVLRHFTLERMAQAYQDLYESVSAKRAARPPHHASSGAP
jgi:sugar transferase (PEP-CTERM/EpsH1 system associated)